MEILIEAILLSLRLLTAGIAWLWCVPSGREPRGLEGLVYWTAWVLALGVPLGLGSALLLGDYDLLSSGNHLLLNSLLAALGLIFGLSHGRAKLSARIRSALPGLALLVVANSAILALEGRSEWVLGGWDPGVYVNQGSHVGATGSFGPFDYPVYRHLDSDHQELFRYGSPRYQQIMPGIPIDPESGEIHVYFFRLMPALVAVLYQVGGVEAAVKVSTFAGFWAAIVFSGMIIAYLGLIKGLLAGAFLVIQPLFIYHLQITTTEMLQLLLLCCFALVERERKSGLLSPVMLSLLVAIAVINRADFFILGAVFLIAMATEDIIRHDRLRVGFEHLMVLLALLVGSWLNSIWSPYTEIRIARFMREVDLFGAVGLGVVILINCLAAIKSVRDLSARHAAKLPWVIWAGFVVAGMGVLIWRSDLSAISSLRGTATRLGYYYGIIPLLIGFIGSFVFVRSISRHDIKGLSWWVFALLIIHTASMLDGKIAGIYPYATRRFFLYMIPVLAIFSSCLVSSLCFTQAKRIPLRSLAIVFILLFVAGVAKPAYHAWSRAEYEGMTDHLAQIARQIEPGDILVVDHAWWGTPLLFLHDVEVLNGSLMLLEDKRNRASDYLEALNLLKEQGYSVRFLTSTEGGMDIFPIKIEPVRLDWEGPQFVMQEIQHHPRGQGFAVRHRHPQFSLYTWTD